MTSNEIIEKLNKLQLIINNNKDFFAVIERLSGYYPNLVHFLEDAITKKSTANMDVNQLRDSYASEAISYMYTLKIGTVFISLQKIIDEVKTLNDKISEDKKPFTLLINTLESLYLSFEESFGNYNFKNTFILAQSSNSVIDILTNTRQLSDFLNEVNLPLLVPQNNETELSFHFTTSIEYKELIIKLTALEELYNEICRLLDVSTSQFPLRLVKLETGSWWIKIFGESKVIAAIIGFTEKSVSYFHRTYTVEGKISKIPKDLEVIDKLLELSKSLEENGIDATVLKNNLQHSSIVLSEQLNKLLACEPNVKINEKEFYIGKDLDEKLLKERQTLLLESGESET